LALAYGGLLGGTPVITLNSNATLDVSATAPWTLGAGQTLGGFGTVYGSVVANGTVAPGSFTNLGTITFNTDLTLAGTNLLVLDKDYANSGQSNDVIIVDGNLTCGGTLTVVLAGSTPLAVNDTFQLFNVSSSPLNNFAVTNLPAGATWDTSQLGVNGTIRVSGIASRPHPAFTGVAASGGSVILSGTNATGSYVLYSSTNLALPLSNWVPVFTNTFNGHFNFTNTMDSAQEFYLLQ
jgi:hypothetical protein